MFRNVLLSAVLAAVPALTSAATPVPAPSGARVELASSQSMDFGPYATMRRANEVANYARSLGYSAIAFHNGNGYYVRVW